MVLLGGLLVASLALQTCVAQLQTAPSELDKLVDTRAFLVRTLAAVVDANIQKLSELKTLLQRIRADHEADVDDPTPEVQCSNNSSNSSSSNIKNTSGSRLFNPIAAYRLVVRLASDWRRAETAMSAEPAADLLAALAVQRRDALAFPTEADLAAAADALIRLQDTYRLETAALARGELHGVRFDVGLSADDCFDLGKRTLITGGGVPVAESWLNEAMARRDGNSSRTPSDILGFVAVCRYKSGDLPGALREIQQALALDAGHANSLVDLAFYRQVEATGVAPGVAPGMAPMAQDQEAAAKEWSEYLEVYKALCRGDLKLEESARTRLRCRYVSRRSWFLRLAPLKEEEAFLSPRILLYHDVISDAEIDAIVAHARPKQRRAKVFGCESNSTYEDPSRTSRSCFLDDGELPALAAVSRRAADLLGLTLANAEQLQVGSYGIGGHYEPHFDHAREHELETFAFTNAGNRIATALFYMNNVNLGGATVFPTLKVSVFPKKGAAVVWFNLHKDGVGDVRTKHAGCPVLAGYKWVANKWFHERGQEEARPCGLVEDSKMVF